MITVMSNYLKNYFHSISLKYLEINNNNNNDNTNVNMINCSIYVQTITLFL